MRKLQLILLLALLVSENSYSKESEEHCLARIMYREAQGESTEGVVTLGQAAADLASDMKMPICKLEKSGQVHSQKVPDLLQPAFHALAQVALLHPKSLSKGADHWDTGKPHMKGKVKRVIGRHVFYQLGD